MNMRDVSVIGVGMISFGKYPDRKLSDLGWPAVKAAVGDANIEFGKFRRFIVAPLSEA